MLMSTLSFVIYEKDGLLSREQENLDAIVGINVFSKRS